MKCKQTGTISGTTQALIFLTDTSYVTSSAIKLKPHYYCHIWR